MWRILGFLTQNQILSSMYACCTGNWSWNSLRNKIQNSYFCQSGYSLTLADKYMSIIHSELEWKIGKGNCLAWNTALAHDFCIPLDIEDLKKKLNRPIKFWNVGLRPLIWPSTFLKFFLRSFMSKKSNDMQKSWVGAIFHNKHTVCF